MTNPLTELAAVLPELDPRIRSLDGSPRLLLTIAAGETLEVMSETGFPHWYRVEAIRMGDTGRVGREVIAVVYGLALIPPIAREFALIRHAQLREARNRG